MSSSPPERAVVSGTSPIHSETFAQALGWPVIAPEEAENSKVILVVGANPQLSPEVEKWRNKGSKVYLYWIGSDSMCAIEDTAYREGICEYDGHVAVHERIRDELYLWYVKASVVYPCPRKFEITPLPEEPLVAVYMPTNGDLYKTQETIEIAAECKNIPFLFYGMMEEIGILPENVKDGGRMTPEEVSAALSNTSCMLRLCSHDGYPVGGIEAMMRNRNVIENYPYDGFIFVESWEQVIAAIHDPRTHAGNGPWGSWYRDHLNPQAFKQNMEKACELVT